MHIIHGTWIPEDTHEFIHRGAFYLWVETDAQILRYAQDDRLSQDDKLSQDDRLSQNDKFIQDDRLSTRSNSNNVHPRHLAKTALVTFLIEKLGLREPMPYE